jgi:protease II
MINSEWPKIKTDIDSGRLSPIGLVQIKSIDPFQMGKNHQVLAYGYDLNGTNLAIRLYDPNHPDDDAVTMSLSIADPQHTTSVTIGTPVWCFFKPDYAFSKPPTGFLLQTGTALHEANGTVTFILASNNDLFAIKKSNTGTHTTEVHVLSAASGYQQFILQTGTVLHETDVTFEFALTSNRDLFAIKKSNTGTHTTEVHVLSAASGYQQFILQTGTVLHETDVTFEFALTSNRDLFAIKKSNTGTHTTEVHIVNLH